MEFGPTYIITQIYAPGICYRRVSVCPSQVGILSKRLGESSWFWHGGFLPLIPHSDLRKFGCLQNYGTSLRNFMPNSVLRKFHQDKSIALSTAPGVVVIDGRACWRHLALFYTILYTEINVPYVGQLMTNCGHSRRKFSIAARWQAGMYILIKTLIIITSLNPILVLNVLNYRVSWTSFGGAIKAMGRTGHYSVNCGLRTTQWR